MDAILLLLRLALVAVFLTAAVAKLADAAGTKKALAGFGVPRAIVTAGWLALPLSEITVSVLLLPARVAWCGALAGTALLGVFSIAIIVSLARGRAPECRCFGELSAAPIGWKTVARNASLVAIGAVVVFQGPSDAGPSGVGWVADLSAVEGVLLGAVVVAFAGLVIEAWCVYKLFEQQGRLLLRLDLLGAADLPTTAPSPAHGAFEDGLPVGTPAPEFNLAALAGGHTGLISLRAAGAPVMLLFSNPNCGPCQAMMPRVAGWQTQHGGVLRIAVLTEGDAEASRAKSEDDGVSDVLLQAKREVAEAYRANGTPAAVLINPDGTVAGGVAYGEAAIASLVASVTHTHEAAVVSGAGRVVPHTALRRLGGGETSLKNLRGRHAILLFWNPHCGYCQQMLPDLKALEAGWNGHSPSLIIISTGSPDDNRPMGLRSTILLDDAFAVGYAVGAAGTPAAVTIDPEGRVTSEVAAGISEVLALLARFPALTA